MPLYVMVCEKCNKKYEAIISLKDYDKPVKCPHCKEVLKRIMSPVMFKI